ncbi:MAG: chromate resistance protein ChrB domain-containing protein, partial [Chromatiaceae bacterium]
MASAAARSATRSWTPCSPGGSRHGTSRAAWRHGLRPAARSSSHQIGHPRAPKIDRIACPWLILRFIDSEAELLYVPQTEIAWSNEKRTSPAPSRSTGLWTRLPRCGSGLSPTSTLQVTP